MGMKQGYRMVMKHRNFMQTMAATVINRIGDSIDMLAFSWLVYGLTESAGWSAIVLGVNMLPNVFIQPIAGAIVEHIPKKRIMVICDIGRGILTGTIIVLYWMHILSPWMLLLITFLNNALESFRNPASVGFIPLILPKEDYEYGLALNQSSIRICELIGTGLAGVILTLLGVVGAIAIDMMTFFISAVIIAFIPLKEQANVKQISSVRERILEVFYSMKDGFSYLKQTKILVLLCILACILNMSLVPLNSFEAAYVSGILHAPAYVLSLMSISLTIGIGIGSFLYPFFHKYIQNRSLIILGGILTGCYYLVMVLLVQISSLWLINLVLASINLIFGISIGFIMVLANISFMSHVSDEYLTRASSIYSAFAILGMPVLSFILSAICEFATVLDILLVFGVFTILLFLSMIGIRSLKEL